MTTLKRFLKYYKPYMGTFSLDMFCALVISVMDLSVPLVASYLLKTVFVMSDKTLLFDTTKNCCLLLLGIYIVRSIAQYYVNYYGHVMGAKMETDMRRDLFSHLEKLSFSYYDKNNTGILMSRMVSDLFDVTELAHHGPEDIFISILKLVGSFLILSSINLSITAIMMLVVAIMFVFSYVVNRHMKKAFMDNRKKIGDVNGILQDSLSGIRVVKSFANEDIEKRKFEKGNQLFLQSKKRAYATMGTYYSFNIFFQGFLYLAVLFFSGLFIKEGQMAATDVVIYLLYISMFLEPINKLVNFTELFQKGFTGFQRMLEVLDEDPDVLDTPGAKEITHIKGAIDFQDVSFFYNEDEGAVLDHISMHIDVGKTVALVGPSGSGKTTFCSLIPRFYEPQKGTILIDGMPIKNITLQSLRKNIGVVQQDVYIFNSTIRENIAYGKPGASEDEIIQAAKRANIHEFILSLEDGYDTLVGERGVRFSGGQKQRISIARVFLKNPPILILDEATSALDNESERYIQKSLEELSKNRTTIVIAHRLSTIRNADEIIVLTNEGVEEKGSHEQLLQNEGLYAYLYNMQFQE